MNADTSNLDNDNREMDFMEISARKIADDIYAKAIETSPMVVASRLMRMAMSEQNSQHREWLHVAAAQLLEAEFFRKRLKT